MASLFDIVVDKGKIHPNFKQLLETSSSEPARWMLDDIFKTLDDPDGNFVEQFQTTGFDARYFELYLYAYLHRTGYHINRSNPYPDFIVEKNGTRIVIEATTVNPSKSGVLSQYGKKIEELTQEDYFDYISNELCIRFGSALYSKISKKYWESEQCKDVPFVIAVEAFHDEHSLSLTDTALHRYLYGIVETGRFSQDGRLIIEKSEINEHSINTFKTITSNLFGQPEAKFISAVLFSNSGTQAKFSRMGFQHGIGNDHIVMSRTGYCYSADPDAMDPTFFSYDLDYPPLVETWGQGLMVLHNPNAIYPISREYFSDASQMYLLGNQIATDHPNWYPMSSKTLIYELHEAKSKITQSIPYKLPVFSVIPISKDAFHRAIPSNPHDGKSIKECGWYTDDTKAFWGMILEKASSKNWEYIIFGRNAFFHLIPIKTEVGFTSRDDALLKMQMQFAQLLSKPKRIF